MVVSCVHSEGDASMSEQNDSPRMKVNPVLQNLVVGSLFGVVIAIGLRYLYTRASVPDWAWILFFIIGPVIGYLSGIERKRYERLRMEKIQLSSNLGKFQEMLKKSSNKYNLIMENLSDAIYLTTEDGRFLLYNQAFK